MHRDQPKQNPERETARQENSMCVEARAHNSRLCTENGHGLGLANQSGVNGVLSCCWREQKDMDHFSLLSSMDSGFKEGWISS
jgi:hypothetical protein